jgi:hypothetical protein
MSTGGIEQRAFFSSSCLVVSAAFSCKISFTNIERAEDMVRQIVLNLQVFTIYLHVLQNAHLSGKSVCVKAVRLAQSSR